ncbi:hypothetical protein KL905_000570 [Ogataea polymorpha]|nr:hypothetical protein KL907_001597 [Ogataea polymorpha]KAG7911224.1 hypothetical protein KL906_001604 [Ogataea polymorpha]KAG7923352.1 hypothetical protein KL905_000570 [Ogataea polymorpha]KAG7927565.1 hypothetical protein KL925_001923 [Ogataea polymorpha]KAG7931737.1 hypothetical protein KL934_004149 [Ogataea polymorpha]
MAELGKNIGVLLENATKNLSSTVNEAIQSKNVKLPSGLNAFLSNGRAQNQELTSSQVIEGLNSSSDKEIQTSLKYLVRLMTTKQNSDPELLQYFPHVIKNITSNNLRTKRLVYIILLRYNHMQQDIALLSINAIQKSLTDKNCINRALAIRTLSGIRIPAILPILVLSIKRTISDSSPLVRSATAVAITKCFLLDVSFNKHHAASTLKDESTVPAQMYNFLAILLSDTDPRVLSSALNCFYTIFPGYMDLIHPRFAFLVSKLTELEDYSKVILIDLATDYARLYLPKPTDDSMAPELTLLDSKLRSLIYSSSANVVLALVRFYVNVLPFKLDEIPLAKMLVKFLGDDEVTLYVLKEIVYLLDHELVKFSNSQLSYYVPLPNEPFKISELKVYILVKLLNTQNFDQIFTELVFLLNTGSTQLKLAVVRLLNQYRGTAEQKAKIGQLYLSRLDSENEELLVAEYVTGLRIMVQNDLFGNIDVLIKLTGKLVNERELTPVARASIIWLVGEFSNQQYHDDKSVALANFLPDLMRILVRDFRKQEYLVKVEILTALTKLVSKELYASKQQGEEYNYESLIWKLFNFVLQLTKYDSNVDLRDRSRMIGSILPNVVYLDQDLTATTAIEFQQYYGQKAYVLEKCAEKLNEVELSILLFQTSKPAPISTDSSVNNSNINKYNQVTPQELNSELLEYYNELRAQEFQLKDYNQHKSISHAAKPPPVVNSATTINIEPRQSARKYKLQTLDDFLKEKGTLNVFGGSEDESGPEDEEDEADELATADDDEDARDSEFEKSS